MELSLEELRKKKLAELAENPFYQTKFIRTSKSDEIVHLFSQFNKEELIQKSQAVSLAGRIMRMRVFGSLIFADLVDQGGTIQLKVRNSKNFSELDIGDVIGVKGVVCKTDKGELSIEVEEFILLSKCLRPLPDTHYGFNDIEERFRKRYLDFIINQEKREIFFVRHKVVKNIRKFLDDKDFIEIETPVLVSEASGAQAKPFITHHNKLQRDFFLRIATEIPLKKMLIGGFDKVYELGRIFRNEGIDARHNPEFTTIEIYQAYDNCESMMNLTEKLFNYLAKEVIKKDEFSFNSHEIKIQDSFAKMSMVDSIKKYGKIDLINLSPEEILLLPKKHNLELKDFETSPGHVIAALFEKYVEKRLINPTFIYDYPIEISPLAKSKQNNKMIADRFELFIGGIEFANGYSELNDPIEQKKRFEEQSKQKELGNEEVADFDKDFLEALEYGMPPAGGLGIGIDRLIMLFTNQNSIKEVIAFPQLKHLL
ncbi:MAG: lysine--tRNA ligase [Spiroplasmataceae bacterium]|jgi:lysyl-tRNA synthetase class 2|nr:lysine--tRNA ligase [Spiroplasmataceae bacterium]